MLLSDCISHCLERQYPAFEDSAPAADVLKALRKKNLTSVPVLHGGKFAAMASFADFDRYMEKKGPLEGVPVRKLGLKSAASATSGEDLFVFFSRLGSIPGPVIPVVGENGMFEGVIRKDRLLARVAEIFHLGIDGMTLELEVPMFGVKMSEVVAAIEKNDATVLSFGSYVPSAESEGMVIIMRLVAHDPFRLVKNIEKYGYVIRYAAPLSAVTDEDLKEKALEFIRFMDL
ncbi:CBS domain-containing protein [Chlorobium sp. N1]|uniref:CBS domain-containing protein n=1 Tax=Chlorobium sp. N1 TaxID=2491138 RepID=UPI00103F8CC7|nr:CBS domain-containing protein [Chlorobium sp. N1]TCD48324.1 CBS domain-containing protein [Chlorobium sp. N1]